MTVQPRDHQGRFGQTSCKEPDLTLGRDDRLTRLLDDLKHMGIVAGIRTKGGAGARGQRR